MKLSDTERDLVIRTILSEAGREDDAGKAAVAHVIINRIKSGQYGDGVAGVLFKPAAFEPWGLSADHKNHPGRHAPNTASYRKAGALLDDALSGDLPDPTKGATHFLNEDVVRERRGGTLPRWAQGQGLKIGNHTFHRPDEGADRPGPAAVASAGVPARASAGVAAINNALNRAGGPGAPLSLAPPGPSSGALPFAGEDAKLGSFASQWFGSAAAPATPATEAKGSSGDEFQKRWMTPETAAPPVTSAAPPSPHPVPGSVTEPAPKQSIADRAIEKVSDFGKEFVASGQRAEAAGHERYIKGKDEVSKGNLWPSLSTKESEITTLSGDKRKVTSPTFEAGGLLNTGLGAVTGGIPYLSAPATLLSATLDSLVKKPVTKITGNPEAGDKAAFLVGARLGGSKATKAVNENRGVVRGLNEIVRAIPAEERASVVKALESNPRLTLADVSPQVQTLATGLSTSPGRWQSFMDNVVKERQATAREAIRGATNELGVSDSAYNTLQGIKSRAAETGTKVIEPVVKAAKPADITGVVKFLDKEIGTSSLPPSPYQRRLIELRDSLRRGRNDKGQMFIDVAGEQGLHKLQIGLREEADTLLRAQGQDRILGKKLMDVRHRLVDAVDRAAEGKYKPALDKYRTDKQVEEAFHRGYGFDKRVNEKSILEESPEAWRAWSKDKRTHADELDAARLGVLANIQNKIGGWHESSLRGQLAPDTPFVRDKLDLLFGKDKADTLMKKIADERSIAETNQKLFAGSKTAMATQGAEALKVRDVSPKPTGGGGFWGPLATGAVLEPLVQTALGAPGVATGVGALLATAGKVPGAVRYMKSKAGRSSDISRNEAIAQMALATGRPRDRLVEILRSLDEAPPQGILERLTRNPVTPALPR